MKECIYNIYYNSPIGLIEIVTDKKSLKSVLFVDHSTTIKKSSEIKPMIIMETYKQMKEYFAGKRKSFDLRISLEGTEFQKNVWKELMSIPYGEIVSYKNIAERIGNPKASRAIGNANNKNKLLIVIPCHRVIGSNGSLNGYKAGLQIKEQLISHEKNMKYLQKR